MSHLKKAVQECYATYYLFVVWGFAQKYISVGTALVANADPPGLYSVVKLKQDGIEFNVHLVKLEKTEEPIFQKEWSTFLRTKDSTPEAELDKLVQSSEIWTKKIGLLEALRTKGFTTPLLGAVNCPNGSLN